jgi:hypothetical protein
MVTNVDARQPEVAFTRSGDAFHNIRSTLEAQPVRAERLGRLAAFPVSRSGAVA